MYGDQSLSHFGGNVRLVLDLSVLLKFLDGWKESRAFVASLRHATVLGLAMTNKVDLAHLVTKTDYINSLDFSHTKKSRTSSNVLPLTAKC